MSRFNTKAVDSTLTENFAGGQAHAQSPELELVSILLTSFATDGYYRSGNDTMERLKALIKVTDPKFVAQAAVFARTQYGIRTISHVAASELAKRLGNTPWAKSFYSVIIHRADDMLEIASYHAANNGKMSNAMKAGFASAFDKFDNYQIAKYRGEGKGIKLIDIVNLVHPVPVEKNAEALKALVADKLKSTETWESKLSAAGSDDELKGAAWASLIKENKLGYLALLRNLNNIMKQAPEVLEQALASLVNPGFIKKSLIFPFQYLVAYKQFSTTATKEARTICAALTKAIDISCDNIKDLGFEGNTLVAVDNSGSMDSPVASSKHLNMSEAGALMGMALAKAINADILEFGTTSRYIHFQLDESVVRFASEFSSNNQVGHGTSFMSIFAAANKKYERIIILSDMQSWRGETSGALKSYKLRAGVNPKLYCIDLAGLGSSQFPEKNVYCLAGFSDKVFQTMKMLETDPNALVNQIKAVTF